MILRGQRLQALGASVPCNGCTACCRGDAIILHPEMGDDPEKYQTTLTHPFTGEPALMLAKKANGDCVYLGESGCTIHGHAPVICREFDCGLMWAKWTRQERRVLISTGTFSKDVFAAGRRVQETRRAKPVDEPLSSEQS